MIRAPILPWFRYHHEALDDPKVQNLDGDTFKAWVNLLCLACRNDGILPPVQDIAFALRIDIDAAQTVVERLLNATLIDSLSGGPDGRRYAPHNWDERQYKSDTSTERVKRFRKRSRNVAETVTETPPDTESESESPLTPSRGKRAMTLLPDDWTPPPIAELTPKARECAERWPAGAYERVAEEFSNYWRSERRTKADWRATFSNRILDRHDVIMRGAAGSSKPGEDPTYLELLKTGRA